MNLLLKTKEEDSNWQKAEPLEVVYIKYEAKKNLPSHEAVLHNQREKEVKALSSPVCVTNKANHNLTPSHKKLPRWHFRLVNLGFQHVHDIMWGQSNLSDAAGALWDEVVEMRNWIIFFGCVSDKLRVVVAKLADWLAKYPPPLGSIFCTCGMSPSGNG